MLVQSFLAKREIEARRSEAAARHATSAAHYAKRLEAAEQRIAIALSAVE
jgi:hypothetical protein